MFVLCKSKTQNIMKNLVLLCNIIVAALLASNVSIAQAKVKMNGPEISINKEVHDYGKIEKGANGECFFTITNSGNEPLIITKAKGSCGCTVPIWPKEAIAPGESAKMSVKYNTQKIGKINKSVTITSNASNNPTKIVNVTGEVFVNKTAPTRPKAIVAKP